jgi:hypothetical protein
MVPAHSLIKVDYVDGDGIPLFEQCDLEGIVAKQKHAPYMTGPQSKVRGGRSETPTIRNGVVVKNCLNVIDTGSLPVATNAASVCISMCGVEQSELVTDVHVLYPHPIKELPFSFPRIVDSSEMRSRRWSNSLACFRVIPVKAASLNAMAC